MGKKKYRQIKGYLKHTCDECGKFRLLKFYDKEGNYICKNCINSE
jgi:uncharacterized protein (DUF983 family)